MNSRRGMVKLTKYLMNRHKLTRGILVKVQLPSGVIKEIMKFLVNDIATGAQHLICLAESFSPIPLLNSKPEAVVAGVALGRCLRKIEHWSD